jgi:WD40 repeat protein
MLQFRQVLSGEVLAQGVALTDATTSMIYGGDGRHLLIVGKNGEARVWNTATGQPATPALRPGGRLVTAQFYNNGQNVITVSESGLACFWELPPGPEVRRGVTAERNVDGKEQDIALPNGFVAHSSGVAEGALKPPSGETRAMNAIISPAGSHIAVCEDAKSVVVFDTAGGTVFAPPLRHRSPVLYAAFSSDGRRLLTASADRSVRLWDVATGELLSPPLAHSLAIERVYFQQSDDRTCVVCSGDREIIWNLTEENHPIEHVDVLTKILAGLQCDPRLPSSQLDPKSARELWERFKSVQ